MGRKWSKEEREKISEKRKKYLKENPDMHPWKRKNKFKSVPCENVKKILKQNNIKFVEEVTVLSDRFFSVDILIQKKNLIIEVNGNQHYNKDGTLREYYQERHDLIKKQGFNIIEMHYSLAFNEEYILNTINTYSNASIVLPFTKREPKKNKYGTRSDYTKAIKKKNLEKDKKIVALLLESDISFGKFGWVSKAAKIIGITPQKVNAWMKRNMQDFYNENCFKRK